jgi:hypothetical protein
MQGGPTLDEMQAAVDRLTARTTTRLTAAAEASAAAATPQAAEEAAVALAEAEVVAAAEAQRAAEEAAAAQAVIDAEGGCPGGWYFDAYLGCVNPDDVGSDVDDGYESSDLEVRCSNGTATVEECFGPGSDVNGNGIADVNE